MSDAERSFDSFPPIAPRPRFKCRRCRCRFSYPRWYRAHYFQCPVCGWREFLDPRKCVGGGFMYPGGGLAPKLARDHAQHPPITGGVM